MGMIFLIEILELCQASEAFFKIKARMVFKPFSGFLGTQESPRQSSLFPEGAIFNVSQP